MRSRPPGDSGPVLLSAPPGRFPLAQPALHAELATPVAPLPAPLGTPEQTQAAEAYLETLADFDLAKVLADLPKA
jgi:hypothetical protein